MRREIAAMKLEALARGAALARKKHELSRRKYCPFTVKFKPSKKFGDPPIRIGRILLKFNGLDGDKLKKGSAMQVPFVTTVSFADRDGMTVHLQYGVAAPSEREARSELQRRLINQEIYNYSISEIRPRDLERSRGAQPPGRRDYSLN